MAKGVSIHIGLNFVGKQYYAGWDGELKGCVNDANDMYSIAVSQGFQAKKLINEQATRQAVLRELNGAVGSVKTGDILLVTYSGHGGQRPDYSGDEDDGMDETWCLFDGELIDDELRSVWRRLVKGVRVLVISDSCHSGSVSKDPQQEAEKYTDLLPRTMPLDVMEKTALIYKELQTGIPRDNSNAEPLATVRLLSGCQDNQLSYDNTYNGEFTTQLKRVWGNGSFGGNYAQFHKQILSQMPAHQSPNHTVIGMPDPVYDKQRPFHI